MAISTTVEIRVDFIDGFTSQANKSFEQFKKGAESICQVIEPCFSGSRDLARESIE